MNLYIAEKREVALVIKLAMESHRGMKFKEESGYFISSDSNECITYAAGHLTGLLDPEDFEEKYNRWNLDDLPMKWPVRSAPLPDKKRHLDIIKKLISKANCVFNACDIDGAGEAIFRNIYDYSKPPANQNVKRILISDNNPNKVILAIQSPRDPKEFDGIYLEEMARSVADQRFGYNTTRLFTLKLQEQGERTLFNSGRVFNAIVWLVCERERSRAAHEKSYYNLITGKFNTHVGSFFGKLIIDDSFGLSLDDKGRLIEPNEALQLVHKLKDSKFVVSNLKRKHAHDSPPLPFDLLSLQIQCRRMLGLSPDETMEITQELRTKYLMITYNRSDSRHLPLDEHGFSANKLSELSKIKNFSFVQSFCDPNIRSRAFDDSKVTAHHAIIITENLSAYDQLPKSHRDVFALIARQYLIQFFPKRERIETEITFETNIEGITYGFKTKTSRTVKLGWEQLFANDKNNDDVSNGKSVPHETDSSDEEIDHGLDTTSLAVGNQATGDIETKQHESKPLPSYTMTALLSDLQRTGKYLPDSWYRTSFLARDKRLENGDTGGIGTAASRSDILKKAFASGFLKEEIGKSKKAMGKIVPTEKGMAMFKLLPDEVASPATTAIWSHYMLRINKKEITPEEFWDFVDSTIAEVTESVKRDGLDFSGYITIKPDEQTQAITAECPCCHGPIRRIKGKFGFFWPCKECNKNFPDYNKMPLHKKCPECGGDLRVIKGKKSLSLGCKNYPKCHHIEK